MKDIENRLIELENKNADPTFIGEVKQKAKELFAEYEDVVSQFSEELEKLSEISVLNEKVSPEPLILSVRFVVARLFCYLLYTTHTVITDKQRYV